jgi:hypothetical protein
MITKSFLSLHYLSHVNKDNSNSLGSAKNNSYLLHTSNDDNNIKKITNNTAKLKSLPSQTTNTATSTTDTIKVSNKEKQDKFGIAMLYSTKINGEEWYMNMSNPTSDPRFDLNDQYKHVGKSSSSTAKFNFTKNSDGSWKVASPNVRIEAFTLAGYNESKITTYNQTELAAKGYMQSPNDWKNVEMTGYVKYNSDNNNKTDENFDWYVRGGKHTDANEGYEGTAYKRKFILFWQF